MSFHTSTFVFCVATCSFYRKRSERSRTHFKFKIDLLRKDFRSEIIRFRARRRKNYEAYTAYMLNNFFKVVAEIWKLQQNNLYAVGLISSYANFFSWRCTRSNRRMSSA